MSSSRDLACNACVVKIERLKVQTGLKPEIPSKVREAQVQIGPSSNCVLDQETGASCTITAYGQHPTQAEFMVSSVTFSRE